MQMIFVNEINRPPATHHIRDAPFRISAETHDAHGGVAFVVLLELIRGQKTGQDVLPGFLDCLELFRQFFRISDPAIGHE